MAIMHAWAREGWEFGASIYPSEVPGQATVEDLRTKSQKQEHLLHLCRN